MKQQANQIRPGWVIENNGKQYLVTKINIITPGKGGAFIQVEMRGIDNGLKTEQRWRTADTVEKLMSEEFDCTLPWGVLTGVRPIKLFRKFIFKHNLFP